MARERSFFATLLLLGVTQGASYPLIRVAVRDLSPAVLMDLRVLFALPVLIGYCVWTKQLQTLPSTLREGIAIGAAGIAVPYLLIGWGSLHADAGVVAVANAAVPIFLAAFAIRLLPSERVSGTRLAGVLVGLSGVAVLTGVRPEGGWWEIAGTLAVVAAAPAYALSFIVVNRTETDVVVVATSSVAIGGLLMLPLALATMPNSAPTAKSITAAAALGTLSTGASSALFYWMLSWHGAARASLLTYVTPVFTLAIGAWFLGEPLTLGKVLGLCLIVFGIVLGARRRRSPAPQPTILAATD